MPPKAHIQSNKNRKKIFFDCNTRMLNSIKDPFVSFIPKVLHVTKRQCSPDLRCFMALKPSLPTVQQCRHRFGITQTSPHNVNAKDHIFEATRQWSSK